MTSDSIVIGGQFNGPPRSANGGYASGLLAQEVDADTVEVTLRAPPPLNVPLRIERADGAAIRVLHENALIADARPSDLDVAADVPAPVTWEEAAAAAKLYRGLTNHPSPTCLTCGMNREPGDGLRLFTGAVAGAVFAWAWEPGA